MYLHLRTAALQLITDKPKLTENLPRWRLLASLPCLNQTLSCHFVGREELIALCAHSYIRHKIMEKPNQSDLQWNTFLFFCLVLYDFFDYFVVLEDASCRLDFLRKSLYWRITPQIFRTQKIQKVKVNFIPFQFLDKVKITGATPC